MDEYLKIQEAYKKTSLYNIIKEAICRMRHYNLILYIILIIFLIACSIIIILPLNRLYQPFNLITIRHYIPLIVFVLAICLYLRTNEIIKFAYKKYYDCDKNKRIINLYGFDRRGLRFLRFRDTLLEYNICLNSKKVSLFKGLINNEIELSRSLWFLKYPLLAFIGGLITGIFSAAVSSIINIFLKSHHPVFVFVFIFFVILFTSIFFIYIYGIIDILKTKEQKLTELKLFLSFFQDY